jgi:aryl sulfotransferase
MPVGDMSPWLDFRLPPLEVKLPGIIAQKHRRFLKTLSVSKTGTN